jgi:hypothetical protein
VGTELFYLNGIDAQTGGYAREPMDLLAVAREALDEVLPPDHVQDLLEKWYRKSNPSYVLADDDLKPTDLADAGWGVVFAQGADPAVREALAPLLARRQQQSSARHPERYRVFEGVRAYRPGETTVDFLGRQGVGPGPVEPNLVPMYLLLVGSPEEIPFAAQYQLDVQYAVGRLHFDTPEEYRRYAEAVVAAEVKPARPRRVVLAGTHHPDDPATEQSATLLIDPLAAHLSQAYPDWSIERPPPDKSMKTDLLGLFAPERLPGLLFAATHGMSFRFGDPQQRSAQGALLCQDWPGRNEWGFRPIPAEYYLSGADLPATGCGGLVAFLFACHGAGTPRLDDYPHPKLPAPAELTQQAFVAELPRRLLGLGAVAVVGHVDRAWPCSFVWKNSGPQLQAFRSVLQRLLRGQPVGWACDKMNLRYAELAGYLNAALQDLNYGKAPDADFGYLWTANNDARAYVVLGDPAARLLTAPPVGA